MQMNLCRFSLIFFLFNLNLLSKSVALAEKLELQDFMKSYLSHSEGFKLVRLNKVSAEQDYAIASDFFVTQLSLTPNWVSFEQESRTTSLNAEFAEWEGEVSQFFSTGTQLSFQYLKQDSDRDFLGQVKHRWALGASQSLISDFFGRASRAKLKEAESRLELAELEFKRNLIRECRAGQELFLKTYTAQEKHKILDQSLRDARKVSQVTRRNLKRKMIRRIDSLTAEASLLEIQAQKNEAALEVETLTESLKEQWPLEKGVKPLQFTELSLKKPTLERKQFQVQGVTVDLERRIAEKNLEVALAAQKRVALQQTRDIQLKASLEDQLLLGTTGEQVEDQRVRVGVQFDWDFFNDSRVAEKVKARALADIALHRLTKLKRSRGLLQKSLVQSVLLDQELIEISKKKVKIYQQQERRGRELLESAKIELIDYLRYRDLVFQEGFSQLDLLLRFFQKLSDLSELYNQPQWVCPEVSK